MGWINLEKSGKKKEMHVQLVKVNKNNRNESSLSEFLGSPFFPGMSKPMSKGNKSLAARENHLWH